MGKIFAQIFFIGVYISELYVNAGIAIMCLIDWKADFSKGGRHYERHVKTNFVSSFQAYCESWLHMKWKSFKLKAWSKREFVIISYWFSLVFLHFFYFFLSISFLLPCLSTMLPLSPFFLLLFSFPTLFLYSVLSVSFPILLLIWIFAWR
jgi:hypothetical protein